MLAVLCFVGCLSLLCLLCLIGFTCASGFSRRGERARMHTALALSSLNSVNCRYSLL
jgi:hypothetical protein